MMRKPKIEMSKSKDGKYYFCMVAAHGQKLLTSRGFETQSAAIEAVSSLMQYGVQAARFERKLAPDGKHWFQLLSPSGRVIAWSEFFASAEGRDNAIVAVRRAVQTGKVLDLN